MTPETKTRLKRFEALKPVAQLYAKMLSAYENADKSDRQRMRRAARKCTETNCWWATYRAAQIILSKNP